MGELRSLVVIHGPDAYLKQCSLVTLLDELVPETERAFGLDRLSGKDVSEEDLLSTALTPSFFGGSRTVLVDDAQALRAATLKSLIAALDRHESAAGPPATVILSYMAGEKPDKSALAAASRTIATPKLDWNNAASWVTSYCRDRHGVMLSNGGAQALIAAIGPSDAGRLAGEVDKLTILAAGGTIDDSHVALGTGVTYGRSGYDLLDRAGEKNVQAALDTLDEALTHPDWDWVRIIINLATHFAKMGKAKAALASGARPAAVESGLGWGGRKIVQQSKNYTPGQIDRALRLILEADFLLKNGEDERLTLSHLILQITEKA